MKTQYFTRIGQQVLHFNETRNIAGSPVYHCKDTLLINIPHVHVICGLVCSRNTISGKWVSHVKIGQSNNNNFFLAEKLCTLDKSRH